MPDERAGRGKSGETRRTDPLELAATIVSALLVLAIAGFLVREAMRDATPPAFALRVGAPRVTAGAHHVPVEVRNTGDESAEQVQVVVEDAGGATVGELTLAWLPAGSAEERWLVLRQPPPGGLTARVVSYGVP